MKDYSELRRELGLVEKPYNPFAGSKKMTRGRWRNKANIQSVPHFITENYRKVLIGYRIIQHDPNTRGKSKEQLAAYKRTMKSYFNASL